MHGSRAGSRRAGKRSRIDHRAAYGAPVAWEPQKPRLKPFRLAVSWVVAAASLYVAAGLVPGVSLEAPGGAFSSPR